METDGFQIVFRRLEKGTGTIVCQEDRRTIRAEQCPQIQLRIEIGCFRETAAYFFRTDLADISHFSFTDMGELGLGETRMRFF
ncbi:hypothetical protein AGR8A_Cc60524 [Agrobacterium fabrum str. J-07]|nr:hypothetical protein AGR8A_Cc60524 [Agrobacterium fabrum str. J-07]